MRHNHNMENGVSIPSSIHPNYTLLVILKSVDILNQAHYCDPVCVFFFLRWSLTLVAWAGVQWCNLSSLQPRTSGF